MADRTNPDMMNDVTTGVLAFGDEDEAEMELINQ